MSTLQIRDLEWKVEDLARDRTRDLRRIEELESTVTGLEGRVKILEERLRQVLEAQAPSAPRGST